MLLTCIKCLPVLKTILLSSFEWSLKTGFIVNGLETSEIMC